MRNFFYGFLIILAAVLVTHTTTGATLGGGSRQPTTSTSRTVSTTTVACSAIALAPTKASTNVVADGRFLCDRPGADSLSMTVTLQKQASATDWVTVSTASFHGVGAETTSAASNASRTHGVQTACTSGTFRTSVEMASVSRGGPKSTKSTSSPVTNPCP